jgi:hypothetical protein
MKLNQALKTKNRLVAEVSRLKDQIKEQNSRSALQPFDYDSRELLRQLRPKTEQLVRIKAAIAQANAAIYEKIFRLSELRATVALLKTISTRHGKFLESQAFSQPVEVEYVSQIRQADLDAHVRELEKEIARLQDELDEFNDQCQIDFELN